MERKIQYESWIAVNDRGTLAEYERKRMSVPWRIWDICLWRANNWGHAGFRPGQLARLVCGDDSRNSRQAVNRGLKTLAEMGRIMPPAPRGSTQLCVVISSEVAQRRAGKGRPRPRAAAPARTARAGTFPAGGRPAGTGHSARALLGVRCPSKIRPSSNVLHPSN